VGNTWERRSFPIGTETSITFGRDETVTAGNLMRISSQQLLISFCWHRGVGM